MMKFYDKNRHKDNFRVLYFSAHSNYLDFFKPLRPSRAGHVMYKHAASFDDIQKQ